jgi:hypothetical protein
MDENVHMTILESGEHPMAQTYINGIVVFGGTPEFSTKAETDSEKTLLCIFVMSQTSSSGIAHEDTSFRTRVSQSPGKGVQHILTRIQSTYSGVGETIGNSAE